MDSEDMFLTWAAWSQNPDSSTLTQNIFKRKDRRLPHPELGGNSRYFSQG
jgi:hypothetical protein